MRKIIIFKVPANVDLDNPDNAQLTFINAVSARWSESIIPGTRPVGGYKLIRLRVTATIAKVQQILIDRRIDWVVMGMRSAKKQIEKDQKGKPVMLVRQDKDTGEIIRTKSMQLKFDRQLEPGITAFIIGSKKRPVQLARGQNDDEIWVG